jgi:hypothetical protein
LVNVMLAGVGVTTAGPTAVPLKGSIRVGLDASDVTTTLPLKVPADCGAKVTLKVVLCPGVKVSGGVIPEILKPVPLAVA